MSNKVYFAGKISKTNWRNKILNVHRISEKDNPYIINKKFEYTGPYFIACDHGCYHGDNTHGRIATNDNMCSEYSEPREKVISKCYNWIDMSDIVFCWIDDITAYGTFAEIGYAFAKQKIIYIACDKKIKKESFEAWFPLTSSDILTYEEDVFSAWENFVKWHENGMTDSYHNLYDYPVK